MAKSAKLREEFTPRSNIIFAILEVICIPVALLLLFWRFEVVYSHTPPPVWDNLLSCWWRDVMGIFFWVYIIFAGLVILWVVAKAYRVIEAAKKERWQAMTLLLIAKKLGISQSDIDAEFQRRGIPSKLKEIQALSKQKVFTKQDLKRQGVARKKRHNSKGK